MTRPNPMLGCYLGAETLLQRAGLPAASEMNVSTDSLVEILDEVSRDFEADCRRYFLPYTATALYRWPQFAPQATWSLWVDEDLLSVTALTVGASGLNAVPMALTHYYLEPQQFGPPYSRIEVDLSYGDAFTSGPTPQRSVSVTGQWGACNATFALGTISGLSSSPTVTSGTVPANSAIASGDLITFGDSSSESAYVQSRSGTTITIQRGVNGTTATTHTDGTSISRYVVPSDVRGVVFYDALSRFERYPSTWGLSQRVAPILEAAHGTHGETLEDHRLRVIEHSARERSYAI